MPNGCSFLEDYTLNFDGEKSSILQSHMLEVCPLIAADKPRLEVHFLGIGIRKGYTARLVFNSKVGKGITATIVDMGNRFRLIVNDVECIEPKPLPKLPVANALWIPMPNFEIGTATWILAGGTHHSCFSYDITPEFWIDYAEMAEIEMLHIDKDTKYGSFRHQLQYNEIYYITLGILSKKISPKAGEWGLIGGFIIGMLRLVTNVITDTGSKVMEGAFWENTAWFWQTNWLVFECWLLVFIVALMVVVSFFTPAPSKAQVEAITFTSDYRKQIRESWCIWDVVATLGVIALCACFYAYFW